MKLSIIIPVYNEEKTIAAVLDALVAVPFGEWEREVIVVDDGSVDATSAILKQWSGVKAFFHVANRGKGVAIRTGLAEACGDAVIIQDADLEYDPADIPRLLAAMEKTGADAVFGSRNIAPERRGYPHYVLGVAVLTGCINLLFRSRLTDAYTGYKLLRTSALKELGITSAGFEFEAEATCLLLKRGYKICEIPIRYNPRSFSEGKKIRFRDGIIGLAMIFKIWRRKMPAGEKIMVFGVFDGFHEGHRAFLREAKTHGRKLIVVVARDEQVRLLKNKTPRHSEDERLAVIARADQSARAVLGDPELGMYDVIKKYQPDTICLGYDQHALAEDLQEKMKTGAIPVMPIYRMSMHRRC